MVQMLSDSQIDELAKKAFRDKQDLEILYRYFYPLVYRYIRKSVFTNEDAEDIVVQIFLKMVRSLGSYSRQKGHFRFWLFRVAKNTLYDFFRAKQRYHVTVLDEESTDADMQSETSEDGFIDDSVTIAKIKEALKELPAGYREVIELRFFAEMTNKEIAHTLNTKEKTVSSNLSRALAKLKTAVRSIS